MLLTTSSVADRIPSQSGRLAIVTGANSGLGFATALALVRAGAHVLLACRDVPKADAAAARIQAAVPNARLEVADLDLGSLGSVREFTEHFRHDHPGLDLLINNAGVMAPPNRATANGFEAQFGTNHLGHFALTGLLLSALEGRDDARIVTVTSQLHRMGRIDFDHVEDPGRHNRWRAYVDSKLANLMFALELDRRLRAAGSPIRSLAAHPGYAATNLHSDGAPSLHRFVMAISNRMFAQSAEMGALPTLFAATHPNLEGGTYVGPAGIAQLHGLPKVVAPARAARDRATGHRLWEVSEELTGVTFHLPHTAAIPNLTFRPRTSAFPARNPDSERRRVPCRDEVITVNRSPRIAAGAAFRALLARACR